MEGSDKFHKIIFSELKILGLEVPKLKKFKSTIPNREKSAQKNEKKIFGVNLTDQESVPESEYYLPKFVAFSTAYLLKHREREGLFRKTGSVARQKNLRIKLENGESIDGAEPNDVASLLKQWLRELPEPLIPLCLQELFMRCQSLIPDENRITAILLSCLLLPPPHLHTFKHLMQFLFDVAASSDRNKMNSHNLARIMAPNIFVNKRENIDKFSNDQVYVCTAVIQVLIEHANEIGEVPSPILLHLDLQSDTELDSCDDDSPFKSKKKLLSGPVQELFNGIRKLVGQGSTSAIKKDYADGTDPPLVLRRALSVKGLENEAACSTAKLKSTGKSKKHDHIRRKSVVLLTKKDWNRLKSCKPNFEATFSTNHNSPFATNNVTVAYPTETVMELAEAFEEKQSSLSSNGTGIKLVNDDIQKSGSDIKSSKTSNLVNNDNVPNRSDNLKTSFAKNENIRSKENGIESLKLDPDFGAKSCSKITVSSAVLLDVVSETPEESILNLNNIEFLPSDNESWSVNQQTHDSPKTDLSEKPERGHSDCKNICKRANSFKKPNLDNYNEVKVNQNITLKTDHVDFLVERQKSEIVNSSPKTCNSNKFQTTILSSKPNRNATLKNSERRKNRKESFLVKNGESCPTRTALNRTESLRTNNTKFKMSNAHRSLPYRVKNNKLSNLVVNKEEQSVTQHNQNDANRDQSKSIKSKFSKEKSLVSSSRCGRNIDLILKHPSDIEVTSFDKSIIKMETKNMLLDNENGSALVEKNIYIDYFPLESDFSNLPKCNDGSGSNLVQEEPVVKKPTSRSRNRKNVARVLSDSTKYSKFRKKSCELVRRCSLPNSGCKMESEKHLKLWSNNNLNCTELCAVIIPTENEKIKRINVTEFQASFYKTRLKIQSKHDGNISDSLNWISGIECKEIPPATSDAAKKRESIAMILKNKSGNVKEKINIYNKLK